MAGKLWTLSDNDVTVGLSVATNSKLLNLKTLVGDVGNGGGYVCVRAMH